MGSAPRTIDSLDYVELGFLLDEAGVRLSEGQLSRLRRFLGSAGRPLNFTVRSPHPRQQCCWKAGSLRSTPMEHPGRQAVGAAVVFAWRRRRVRLSSFAAGRQSFGLGGVFV